MTEPTLQQVFGLNCTQTTSELVISKPDLQGLTVSDNNSAESLFVAILKTASTYLTSEKLQEDVNVQIGIERGSDNIITKANQQYRQYQLIIELIKLDSSNNIDPNDY
jgi:hypothetical protein